MVWFRSTLKVSNKVTKLPTYHRVICFYFKIFFIFNLPCLKGHANKLWWNGPYMVFYQICVWHPCLPTKMAATAELSLTYYPRGNSLKNLLVWNYLSQLQTIFGGVDFIWSSTRILSGIPNSQPRWLQQPNLF